MQKYICNVVTLLSLIPASALKAQDQDPLIVPPLEHRIVHATDPRVLELFGKPKEQIAPELIKLFQKKADMEAEIKQLRGTINERSWRIGFQKGLATGAICVVAAAIVSSIVSYSAGRSSRR